MGWLKIVQLVLGMLPTVVTLIKTIVEAIGTISDKDAKKQAVNDLNFAVKEARTSGDLSRLELMKDQLGIRDALESKQAAKVAAKKKIVAEV